ncbi:MAG TPA: hypothetical protein VEI02_12775 [Planctomycetota bacterium]|nr:hypothetical protein [Planctomycetota bacterium]
MNLEDLLPSGPVPPELHSAYHGGPFPACSDCGGELDAREEPYLVERVFRDGEAVFEYALCFTCAARLFEEYSEESKRNLDAYFAERLAPAAVAGACDRCGRHGAELEEERTQAGAVLGGYLLGRLITICGPCADGAEAVLSKKTKEAFERFVRRVCPTLPADVDVPAGVLSF